LKSVEALIGFEPPPVDESFIRGQCERLMQSKGGNFALASVGFALFERAWSLCGMEDLLCYMLTDPGAVAALFNKLTAYNLKKLRIALEYGFDGVIFGDDWGQQKGLIMGAPLWRKLIKPFVAAMYAEVKSKGKFIAQHTCGDNREILDDLIDIGLNVYQTFQPEIYGMSPFKEKYAGRLTIWGGISTQTQLPFLTPAEVYGITKNAIAILGKGGGYIAAPTHDAPADIPPENIEAMIRAFMDQ
jgi:uroporphyrinogen decarboxylase